MKLRVEGEENFDQARGQINLSIYLAFFLFWVESARHFYNTVDQFVTDIASYWPSSYKDEGQYSTGFQFKTNEIQASACGLLAMTSLRGTCEAGTEAILYRINGGGRHA